MTNTPNYQLTIAEGTDYVNLLTQVFPNFTTIDTAMATNRSNSIGGATEVKTGTIHAITRENTGNKFFMFYAVADYVTGDSFTLDGTVVDAISPSGQPLVNQAFIGGTNVLCVYDNNKLTVFTNTVASEGIDLSQYMKTSDYVGAGATQTVANANNAATATTALNAQALNNQPASSFATASQVNPLIQNIQAIQVVDVLPDSPVSTTLYLVKETSE